MKEIMPKELAGEISSCEECPFRVSFTDYADIPETICYCALRVTRGRVARFWHLPPDMANCPLRKM